MVNFLFALIELSSLSFCYSSGVMWRNVYSSAVFIWFDLFALKFYLNRVVPHHPISVSEN